MTDHGPLDQEHLPEICAGCLSEQLRALVNSQAEDEALWFVTDERTAPEGYLQQELRKLHDAVESFLWAFDKQSAR